MVTNELHDEPCEETLSEARRTVSRVVLIVFLFVLFCLIIPSLVGENKGIPTLRWYGCAVLLAGFSALIAGRIAHHRYTRALSDIDTRPGVLPSLRKVTGRKQNPGGAGTPPS